MTIGGSQTGGISIYCDSSVNIHGNSVDQYERFGIVANGDGGANPSPTVILKHNGDGSKTEWGAERYPDRFWCLRIDPE